MSEYGARATISGGERQKILIVQESTRVPMDEIHFEYADEEEYETTRLRE